MTEELTANRPLLGDGGMGSQLIATGLPAGKCGDLWNIENPSAVRAVHSRYVAAGSDIILTNTFGANAGRLSHQNTADKVRQINAAGAKIAREAMDNRGFVLGDIGPYGGFLEPIGEDEPENIQKMFEEQVIGLLTDEQIDGFMIETMAALEEIQCIINAVRAHSDLPIFISMSFENTATGGLRTMMGVTPQKLAQTARQWGVAAMGTNCGTNLKMDDYVAIATAMRDTANLPLIVQPNAGAPEIQGTTVIYHDTPDMMAQAADRLLAAGINILGGCCGTTPEHIAAFRRLIDVRY